MGLKQPFYSVDLDETEELVSAGPCELVYGSIYNTHSAAAFVKFYDAASASDVTVGTTVPVLTVAIPAASSAPVDNVSFSVGVVVAATANAADNDSAAPTAAVVASLATI